ncbi:MAG: acyloxyacyl hydrolase [Bacteroidaceae bacterium]|nr:acyloxyacyl hydrolase [Bacteroidaceae bacterium]
MTELFAMTPTDNDSLTHYSIGTNVGPAYLLGRTDNGVNLVKSHSAFSYTLFLNHIPSRLSSNVYDRAWHFPELEFGVQLVDFSNTKLSRDYPTPHYFSNLGLTFSAYAAFRRNIISSSHYKIGYTLENGLSWCTRPYNRLTNVDNEFIGAPLSIYFGTKLFASYQFASGLEAGLSFGFLHFSNGALDRPNKGANSLSVTARVTAPLFDIPHSETSSSSSTNSSHNQTSRDTPKFYIDTNVAFGFKSLLDEWVYNYYFLQESDPDYQSSHYPIHPAFGISISPMWRYSVRYASGFGIDYNYATYSGNIRSYDLLRKIDKPTNPHSIGLALRHEAFFKQMSLSISLGHYLFRKMGYEESLAHTGLYETLGLRWYPSLFQHKAYLAYDVKAQLLKADCLELRLGILIGKSK